ncbi:iron chaperone [Geodermatophilus sp. SYSU D00705]
MAAPATLEEYLAGLPEEVRGRMAAIRAAIRDAVPGVGETIRYAMPTFTLDGRSVVHVAAWRRHIALYPLPEPGADPDLGEEVAPHRGAKDAMHLPHRDPLPLDLVVRVVQVLARRAEG